MAHFSRLVSRWSPLFIVAVAASPAWASGASLTELCGTFLVQRAQAVEESELQLELFETELDAAEQIFRLLDELWKQEAVERLAYLTAKHDRDTAKVSVARQEIVISRDRLLLQQYESLCATGQGRKSKSERAKLLNRTQAQYETRQCEIDHKRLESAKLDLDYRQEVLRSVLDLRKNEAATRQDVIFAERNVAKARQRIENLAPRTVSCRPRLRPRSQSGLA